MKSRTNVSSDSTKPDEGTAGTRLPRYPVPPFAQEGQGPTLILVPGLDGTAQLFYRQLPLLSPHFRVVTFPLPNDNQCTMNDLVEELRLLVERLAAKTGHHQVFLCGESFGGALSMSFGLAYPEHLHGLVIVNSFPRIRKRLQIRLGPLALRAIPWGAMRLVRRFTESKLHSAHTHPDDLREFHERTQAVSRTGYIRRLEILQEYDIRDKLRELEVPTLFLASDQDRLVPSVREAQFMSERVPDSEARILEAFGHICLIHHDFDLMEYLDPWVTRLSKPPG